MQIPLIWVYLFAGFAAGMAAAGIVAFFVCRRRQKEHFRRLDEFQAEVEESATKLEEELDKWRSEAEKSEELLSQSRIENASLKERVERVASLERKNGELEEMLENARRYNLKLEKELSEANMLIEAERTYNKKSLQELKDAKETMRKEFKILASQIMEENSRRFGIISKDGVEQILKPLQHQVSEFKKRIEQVYTDETKEMAALMNEIKSLKELNRRISEDAINLTRALKGESKQQGIWGEMVLERVLEASGLRAGEEYEREVGLKDGENRRLRPDVIVRLPGGRDIVVDAKTSLVAYERYVRAEDDARKKEFAKLHLEAVKSHIDKLSGKNYASLDGINSLDFIFMFMPIEGALMLALQSDPSLYDRAFEKHIVLVSPTTLLVALRAVENTWRREKQNRNAIEIAKRAGSLYDKFVSFASDLEKVGKQLATVQRTYDDAWKKLTEGRGNIVGQIQKLEELGAKTTKRMPGRLAEEAKTDEMEKIKS